VSRRERALAAAAEIIILIEEIERAIFDHPEDPDLQKVYEGLMEILRRKHADIAEFRAGDYTLPDMGRERGFQP
jgi:hypothetical protein